MSKKVRLAENIRLHIQKHGLSISQTAQKIGMNKATLHNYSNGVHPRNLDALIKLADFFGVSLSELLYGTDGAARTQKGKKQFLLTIEAFEDDHDDH